MRHRLPLVSALLLSAPGITWACSNAMLASKNPAWISTAHSILVGASLVIALWAPLVQWRLKDEELKPFAGEVLGWSVFCAFLAFASALKLITLANGIPFIAAFVGLLGLGHSLIQYTRKRRRGHALLGAVFLSLLLHTGFVLGVMVSIDWDGAGTIEMKFGEEPPAPNVQF